MVIYWIFTFTLVNIKTPAKPRLARQFAGAGAGVEKIAGVCRGRVPRSIPNTWIAVDTELISNSTRKELCKK